MNTIQRVLSLSLALLISHHAAAAQFASEIIEGDPVAGGKKQCTYTYQIKFDDTVKIVEWEAVLAAQSCYATCKFPVSKAVSTGFKPGCPDGSYSPTEAACPSVDAIIPIIGGDSAGAVVQAYFQPDRRPYKTEAELLNACKQKSVQAICKPLVAGFNGRNTTYTYTFPKVTGDCRGAEKGDANY